MSKIPVFLASDDNYSPFVTTTMVSILIHTKEFIEFYILDCGIEEKNKRKIEKLRNEFKNCSIEFLNIDVEKYFKDFPQLQFISRAMYARYLIPKLKPEINRAIYSDIDVAFVSDIKTLWDEDMSDFVLGAVPSQRGRLNNNYSEVKKKLNLSFEHKFFMTGLLLIDCKKWREQNLSEKLFQKTQELQNKIDLPDQEVFNVVFDNNYCELDSKYCVIYKIFNECYDRKKINYLLKNQVIVHYPGALESKPWNNKKLKSAQYFWRVVNKTDFKKEIKTINKNFNKMKNKPIKKILEKIFSAKNSDNKKHKIITVFGLKFKIKKPPKPVDYSYDIRELNNKVQSLRILLDSCIDITKIPPAKGPLRKLQLADTLFLRLFDNICKKYNLSYWLDGGTLLGAIRHKGFIPWDDDIDIGMLRDDYNKIADVMEKELPCDLFEINEGKGFYRKVIRVIFRNSPIQIDIWPYDKYYTKDLSFFELDKLRDDIFFCYEKFWQDFSALDVEKGTIPFPRREISEYCDKFILKNNKINTDAPLLFRGPEAWLNRRCVYDWGDIMPIKYMSFEDCEFAVPNNSLSFLDKYYGEYMSLPDFNMQITGHSNINDKLASIDDDIEVLKEFYEQYAEDKVGTI